MTSIYLDAIRDVIVANDDFIARFDKITARTPGGPAKYTLTAPMRRLRIRDNHDGTLDLTAATAGHGPVAILRMTGTSSDERVDAVARRAAPNLIANPNLIDDAYRHLADALRQLTKMSFATRADQSHILEGAIQSAAVLLLDPDTIQRQERLRRYWEREAARRRDYIDMLDWSYRAGSPGSGKRA